MRVEIGAGTSTRKGFIHTDLVDVPGGHLEHICDADNLPFENDSVEEIFMEGVFEHFGMHKVDTVLAECYRVLKVTGIIELTTPNLLAICKIILDDRLPFNDNYHKRPPLVYALSCLYGGQDREGMFHKWAWTVESLTKKVVEKGFKVRLCDSNCYEPHTHIHMIVEKV